MQGNAKKKIAVLTSGWSIEYVTDVISGIKSVADKENTDVYVFSCYQFTDQLLRTNTTGYNIYSLIDYKDFDGVILLANIIESEKALREEVEKIKKAGIPAVSIYKKIEGIDFISADDSVGFLQLLQHTKDVHNCTDYAYIGGPGNTNESQLRLQTFFKFVGENHIQLKANRLFLNGDYSNQFAINAAQKLLKNKNDIPEIIVCVNDNTALSVMSVAIEYGIKIPDELKVIGFDNIPLAQQAIPSISTCDAQNKNLGIYAAKKVLKLDCSEFKSEILPSIPIIGQSCGCKSELNKNQSNLFIDSFFALDDVRKFNGHLHHMEDVFLLKNDSDEILNELGNFFLKDHSIEGSDFAIQIQNEYMDSFSINDISLKTKKNIDGKISAIIQIVNDKKVEPCVFDSSEIISPALRDKKPALYLIMPLVYIDSLIGYCTFKNSVKILFHKRGYQWMRNLCNHFETYKQKSSYRQLSEKYLSLATQDALSGVLNRYGYNTFATELFEKNKSSGKSSVVIFADINSMKTINDQFGHLQGDFAIKTIADAIQRQLPEQWQAVRYGGDEFLVIGEGSEKDSADFCTNFETYLKENVKTLKLPYNLSVSLGSSVFQPDSECTLDQAVETVDELMYKNKRQIIKPI